MSQWNALRDRYEQATLEVDLAMIEMDILNRHAAELGWAREASSARRERALVGIIQAHAALIAHRESQQRT